MAQRGDTRCIALWATSASRASITPQISRRSEPSSRKTFGQRWTLPIDVEPLREEYRDWPEVRNRSCQVAEIALPAHRCGWLGRKAAVGGRVGAVDGAGGWGE